VITVKVQIALAWETAFKTAFKYKKSNKLNEHFKTVMENLYDFLMLEDNRHLNVFHKTSYSLFACLKYCDKENLKEPLSELLETVLSQIGKLYSNSDAYLESRETFLNNYCSLSKDLIEAVGSENIEDELLKKIVDLAVFVFN
jgi:hypothetical protein